MCFSAPVSFISSGVLGIIGVTFALQVKQKRLLPLALIPCFFAIQQAAEGFVWLSLPNTSFAKNIFLFFAYAFWPIWVPFSLWIAEKNQKIKQVLTTFLGIGIVIGCLLSLLIPQTSEKIHGNSIHYFDSIPITQVSSVIIAFYGISTLLPFFLSTFKKIWGLGVLVLLAGLATYFFDRLCFVSVWCFFSAILSLYIIYTIKINKH